MPHPNVVNIAAYKFTSLDGLPAMRDELRIRCHEWQLKGTILLSREGINLFVAGDEANVERLMDHLRRDARLSDLEGKVSLSDRQPFNRMLIKIKKEIIAFGDESVTPAAYTSKKISAVELEQQLIGDSPPVLLDVRNTYETKLGTFQDAITLEIDHFRQFPDAIQTLPEELKARPLVMFCTGGIRCEKAGPLMERCGFENVSQLDGGILKYFEKCQDRHYDGECFVFDQRVSVDHLLRETETTQCYACQAPLTPTEQDSTKYQPGISCPYCFQAPDERELAVLRQRRASILEHVTPLPGSLPYTNRRPIFVGAKDDQSRLLDFLSTSYPFSSRAAWAERIEAGFLLRHEMPLIAEDVVRAGDRLEHLFPETVEPDVNANIEVLYEDEWLIGVHKPAPLPMHPCGRFNRNSLVRILESTYAPQNVRPAHRLDANTSGVVVFTLKQAVARRLQPQFETAGRMVKTYLARVFGHPADDDFVCDAPISTKSVEAGARTIDENGLSARTEFTTLQRFNDGSSLLRVHPITGRTNQIRLHLWHLGFSIQGDAMYLPGGTLGKKQTLAVSDPPLCLHAWKLEFDHPMTDESLTLTAPAPAWAAGASDARPK